MLRTLFFVLADLSVPHKSHIFHLLVEEIFKASFVPSQILLHTHGSQMNVRYDSVMHVQMYSQCRIGTWRKYTT